MSRARSIGGILHGAWCLLPLGAPLLCACASGPLPGERPFRDPWRVEAEIEFVHTGAEGDLIIPELRIGGVGNGNFANRGDVIVTFDGPPDLMTVELRRFVAASTEDSAREQLALIGLWAYEGALELPGAKDPNDDCTDHWRAGCQLRVFQDAQTQREVAGADIRVTLPADYRGALLVQTEDDAAVGGYLDRGDVCIDGLPGSAEVQLHSGRAFVRLRDDVSPVPTCAPADVAACERWSVMGPDGAPVLSPWAPECPCLAAGESFGRVIVDTRDVDAADAVVDVPASLWTTFALENRLVDARDRECTVSVSLPEEALSLDEFDSSARARGALGYPGQPAWNGAGYRVSVRSGTCGPVGYAEDPDEFAVDEPPTERRGDLEVCTGCIVDACDVLVP
ncbi:hypothetical protein [Paraliomyxa miuraensis]|uniref:hypothetical protein n=1 Tax=Paraliomyxa miuraensis TaxID=376150 RepID=UPI0022572008|nr:hypothetical protein [Paraliomyxa miuraensis]MCX4243586.1 hypothetical protein [Paraliomyxa miuraensis]